LTGKSQQLLIIIIIINNIKKDTKKLKSIPQGNFKIFVILNLYSTKINKIDKNNINNSMLRK